jgi:hypothetical protein
VAKYKGGIVFPFDQGDDVDPWVILRNIPELAAIYETKVRSPYKVVFEVCRLSELKGQDLYSDSRAKKLTPTPAGDGGTGSAVVRDSCE